MRLFTEADEPIEEGSAQPKKKVRFSLQNERHSDFNVLERQRKSLASLLPGRKTFVSTAHAERLKVFKQLIATHGALDG